MCQGRAGTATRGQQRWCASTAALRQEDWTGLASAWLVDKPSGVTSHDVVAAVRRSLGLPHPLNRSVPKSEQVKVGHTGTLDPWATGLLVVVVGKATRLSPYFTGMSKCYDVEILLGSVSDTHDITGEVTPAPPGATAVSAISNTDIDAMLSNFVGTYSQRVPAYSAVQVGGQRLYKLAREGNAPAEADLPVRPVTINSITRTDAGDVPGQIAFRVDVTKGTYIRALARDMGDALGCGALCASLRRTTVGDLSVADAVTADEVELVGGIPLGDAMGSTPALQLSAKQVRQLGQLGCRWWDEGEPDPQCGPGPTKLMGPDGVLVGIYDTSADGRGKVKVNLLRPISLLPNV